MEHPYRAAPPARVRRAVWRRPPRRPRFVALTLAAAVVGAAAAYAAWPVAPVPSPGACYEACANMHARCRASCDKPWCAVRCARVRSDCEADCRAPSR